LVLRVQINMNKAGPTRTTNDSDKANINFAANLYANMNKPTARDKGRNDV